MAKHGGAWKVAYADFITAMMALFMVLWILGTEQELLEHMQEYFRNPPSPWERESGKYMMDLGEYSTLSAAEHEDNSFFEEVDPAILRGIVEELYSLLEIDMEAKDSPPVEMVLTSDGLRMIIFDRPETPFFKDAGTELTQWGEFLLQNLAWLLSRYRFQVEIEAHSERMEAPDEQAGPGQYGPWELSIDRANEVRRNLAFFAGGEIGIRRVSGYGATRPLEEDAGKGRTHQRVTISLSVPTSTEPPKVNRIPQGTVE